MHSDFLRQDLEQLASVAAQPFDQHQPAAGEIYPEGTEMSREAARRDKFGQRRLGGRRNECKLPGELDQPGDKVGWPRDIAEAQAGERQLGEAAERQYLRRWDRGCRTI